jgi:hypothetical protein
MCKEDPRQKLKDLIVLTGDEFAPTKKTERQRVLILAILCIDMIYY